MRFFSHALCLLAALFLFACPAAAMAEEVTITITDSGASAVPQASANPAAPADQPVPQGDSSAREAFIDGILELAKQKFDEADGRAQRAHYSSDIYVCKNFTVYLFRQNAERFGMAEFPNTPLIIPDNKPKKECTDYVYGVEWKDIPASEGNPFYAAATFRYDTQLSKAENQENARAFLRQVKRGDYFQMAANYYYGIGAHSMVFTADYDPQTDSVRWCDSNMKGKTKNGERYGYVQYDAEKPIDWFVDAFCRKKYGATLYRLRDDIVPANERLSSKLENPL
ncbi:MAG: hypothetical protein RSH26_00735 [Clostridia bacterium]